RVDVGAFEREAPIRQDLGCAAERLTGGAGRPLDRLGHDDDLGPGTAPQVPGDVGAGDTTGAHQGDADGLFHFFSLAPEASSIFCALFWHSAIASLADVPLAIASIAGRNAFWLSWSTVTPPTIGMTPVA